MKKSIFLWVMLFIYVPVSLFAQLADSTDLDTIDLKEFVHSATKTKQATKDVSQLVETISKKEITNYSLQTTADLLQKTANIFVQKSQQGGGSPVLRGFEANKILLEVDGVRLNNLIYRAGHLQNVINLDNSILEKVEVLYGPSSTVYGSDALGGVIHFYTKNPMLSFTKKTKSSGNAYFRYGSINHELTGHLDFNLGWKKFASLTSVTFSKFDDLKMGENQNLLSKQNLWERPTYIQRIDGKDSVMKNKSVYLQNQSGYWQYNLLQKFLFQQNETISHQLNFQFSSSSNIPRYDRLTDTKDGKLRSAEWYYGPQQWALVSYVLSVKNKFFNAIDWNLSYQNVLESRHNRNVNSDFRNDRTEHVNVASSTLSFLKNMKDYNIRFGIDAQLNWLKSEAQAVQITTGETKKIDSRYPDGKNYMHNVAVYVANDWSVNKNLVITDGLRLGYTRTYSTISDNSFFNLPVTTYQNNSFVYSGNLGLVYKYYQNCRLFVNFSTGYRVPNMDDLSKIFETTTGSVLVPNNHLKPEKTLNGEIGLSNTFFKTIRWDVNGYYTYIIDAVTTAPFQLNGKDSTLYDGVMSRVYANQNNQKAFITGFSTSLAIPVTKYFLWTTKLNYTYGRIKTDSVNIPLDHIAPLQLQSKLAVNYQHLAAFVAFNFQDAKRLKDYNPFGEDNLPYATPNGTPAWFTLDLNLSYQFCKYFTWQFGIDNLLDTQYRVFASGINASGRNIHTTLRFKF